MKVLTKIEVCVCVFVCMSVLQNVLLMAVTVAPGPPQ